MFDRLAVGEDFNPEVGFVRRTDIRRHFITGRFSLRESLSRLAFLTASELERGGRPRAKRLHRLQESDRRHGGGKPAAHVGRLTQKGVEGVTAPERAIDPRV